MTYLKSIKTLLAAGAALGLVMGAAQAQYDPGRDTVVITRADNGQGADINVRGSLTPQDMAILLGITPPPSDDAKLIMEQGQPPRWSTQPLDVIDVELGGDGSVEIDLFPDAMRRPPANPAPRDTAGSSRSASSGSAIQPRSGMWQADAPSVRTEGCPSVIASNMGGFMNAGRFDTGPRQVTFDGPFNPAALPGLSDQLNFSWLQMDPNTWIGTADLPGTQGMTPSMQLTVRLLSPVEMQTVGVVSLNFPQQLLQTLGGGADCRAVSETVMRRISD
ncbi:hypothetical protein ACFELO_03590 [Oceanicaulis sp. LC35]|uniref:hypothetical protein n=1 Tax=Oceanicaulis sp. LC35 TaxID=3349635 RepID=UPI003F83A800